MSDDLNDVRIALSTNSAAIKLMREQLEAMNDKLERLAQLGEFIADIKRVIDVDVPETIKKLEADPLMGPLLSNYTSMVNNTLFGGLDRARAQRGEEPAYAALAQG